MVYLILQNVWLTSPLIEVSLIPIAEHVNL